jgi:N-sulfoglucosamine sulfohydrolase
MDREGGRRLRDALNILYIHSHDTGRYVQPYGHRISTPSIQRLAEEGVLFRQAYSTAPTCSPSRAGLLTGTAPHSCGQFGLVNRGFVLRDVDRHIARTLAKAGYATILAGVQHVVRDPKTTGYTEVLPGGWRKATEVAPAAARLLLSKPQEPFFLDVGFLETHRGFPPAAAEDDPRFILPPAPLPDAPETRADMAAYMASARALDSGIGVVLQALESAGLARRTLVICTTDHGISFPFMKCNLTDHGLGVMLIVRGPGGFEGGRACDAMVSHRDLFPTICEVTGVPKPSWLQGMSLVPLVRGNEGELGEINEEVFGEVTYHCTYEPQRAVRTKRWKYIRRYLEGHGPHRANCDSGPSKDLMLRLGWAERIAPREQLFDLAFDSNESCDLAGDPAMVGTLETMRAKLDGWMKATDDPLLRGDIPAPEGAVVSRPDDTHPQDVWTYTERPKGYG